jgi:hypothetical protein
MLDISPEQQLGWASGMDMTEFSPMKLLAQRGDTNTALLRSPMTKMTKVGHIAE